MKEAMWKEPCGRRYVEEAMWKKLCGRSRDRPRINFLAGSGVLILAGDLLSIFGAQSDLLKL